MKQLIAFTIALTFAVTIAACGGTDDSGTGLVSESAAAEVTFCSCVNEPIRTDARANACNELMTSITPAEIASRTMACREAEGVPEGGPDLCYCLQTTTTDPLVAQACQELIPKNMTPTQLSAKIAECASK